MWRTKSALLLTGLQALPPRHGVGDEALEAGPVQRLVLQVVRHAGRRRRQRQPRRQQPRAHVAAHRRPGQDVVDAVRVRRRRRRLRQGAQRRQRSPETVLEPTGQGRRTTQLRHLGTVHCIYNIHTSPMDVTRSLHSREQCVRPLARPDTKWKALTDAFARKQKKNVNRERRPVNLNLISWTPPLNRAVAPNLRASRSDRNTSERDRARVVLTRERRFNESLFNGASCLFIIKSGAVFAGRPPSPAARAPRPAPAKNYCATNNKLEWQSLCVRIIAEGSPVIYVTNIILIDTALDLLRNKTPIELETSAKGLQRAVRVTHYKSYSSV